MTEGALRDRAGYLATFVVTRWVLWSATLGICLVVNAVAVVMAAWLVLGLAARPTFHGRLLDLVGPGPGSAPDFPRPSPDSPTSCPPTANRRSDAPSSLSSPDSGLQTLSNGPAQLPNELPVGVPTRLFIAPGGEAALGFFTRSRAAPFNP